MRLVIDLDAKPIKCRLCRKVRGDHKAVTLNCPMGQKSRIGWTSFDPDHTFTAAPAQMTQGSDDAPQAGDTGPLPQRGS